MPVTLCTITRRNGALFCATHQEPLVSKAVAEARLGRAIDQPTLGLFCPTSGQMYSDTTAANDVIDESGIELR